MISDKTRMLLLYESLGASQWEIEFDEDGCISEVHWGENFLKKLGYSSNKGNDTGLDAWVNSIADEDRKITVNALYDVIKDKSGQKKLDIIYRMNTYRGETRWYRSTGLVIRREDGTAQTFYGLIMDIHEETIKMQKAKEQLGIVKALSRDYVNVIKVNVSNRTGEVMNLDAGGDYAGKHVYPYEALIRQYAMDRIYPGDQDRILKAMQLEVVCEKLGKQREYIMEFRALIGAEIHYYQFKCVMVDDDKEQNTIIIGFKNIDDIVNAAKERDSLIELSETDGMTKLLNRACGQDKATEAIRRGEKGMLVIFDIDNFKTVNDTFGHNAGDKVIIGVASSIKSAFRDDDIVFRLGGDEFAAMAFHIENEEVGTAITDRIFKNMENLKIPEIGERRITLSCGAVIIDGTNNFGFEDLYKQADSGVYESKKVKGNAINFYNET